MPLKVSQRGLSDGAMGYAVCDSGGGDGGSSISARDLHGRAEVGTGFGAEHATYRTGWHEDVMPSATVH